MVYQVGSRWEEKCKTCACTEQTDRQTGLHIAQCVDPVCNQICPLVGHVHADDSLHFVTVFSVYITLRSCLQGTTYWHSEGECCGRCRASSCVEDGRLRQASVLCCYV